MNSLTRIMSYDKTKIKNQENCNCMKCVSVENAELKNQTIEYPKLSEEEIEKIIFERYSDKDEKTKTFIRKALRVHGDCYDYSNVIYVKAKSEVEIICRVEGHKPFLQTPDKHLSGHGCSICGVKKRAEIHTLTTKEFIEKANKVQGIGVYDYSKVEYINAKTKITIICPKHGEFLQTLAKHLQSDGCPKCNKNKGEEVVRKFLILHNIEFEEQKTFKNCKYKQPLKFDFYLPKYNLCIESDGSPHYRKVNWNGKMTDEEMKENLKLNQHRDNIKNDYCKKNGIVLLRFNAFEILKKLTEYFQNHAIIAPFNL